MYICIYVYMHICIYAYMYICIYAYMYICIYVYLYICKYVNMCEFTCHLLLHSIVAHQGCADGLHHLAFGSRGHRQQGGVEQGAWDVPYVWPLVLRYLQANHQFILGTFGEQQHRL